MKRALFAAAAVALAGIALAQHDAVHDSLAAHMVQHLVLILLVAPLLAAATPAYGAPRGWWATSVISVVLLNTIALWAWHLPALYDAAVENDAFHVVEHLTFVATAWIFWLTVMRGSDHLKGAGIVFLVGLQSAALGALLTFASEPLYASHAAGSERLGLTALEDQQLAGGIMWVPPGVVYLVVTLLLLNAWMRRSGRPVTET